MAERQRAVGAFPENVPVYAVPDRLCNYAGLSVCWKGDKTFGVFPYQHTSPLDVDKPSQYAPAPANVHHIRTDSILFNPIVRKLVNESSGFFLDAQKLSDKSSTTNLPLEVLKLSRKYRSVIQACLENLQDKVEVSQNAEKDFYLENIPTFYNMELIWHLCEIFFIDALPGDVILSQLLNWVKFHIPQVEKDANQILISEHEDVTKLSNYWIIIIGCLLQRRIDTVRSLLKLHPKSNSEVFKMIDSVLRTMPIFDVYGGLTLTEFQVRHECWKREAQRILMDGTFASYKYLEIIMKIITGNETVQDIIRSHCETWYQHLIASLTYSEPTVKIFDLSFYANQSITRYGGPSKMKPLDWILFSIMELDIFKVIERIQDWTEKNWLPTHLANLFYLNGKLSSTGNKYNNLAARLHEELILDYGTLMLSHRTLWQVGVSYLDHCPTEGKLRLETLLSRIPFKTEEKAMKIIQVAKERDLKDVVFTVSRVQGMRCLQRGDLGAALTWSMRCQDSVFSTQLADMFLKKYISDGTFHSLDLIENLGAGMMLSDRLAFLGKYCEFCQMSQSGDQKEAATLLVQMLINKVPPKYFWLTLLLDAIPLLECNKGLFTIPEIYDLMTCVEELTDDSNFSADDKIVKIRSALAKNLATEMIKAK